MEAFNKKTDVKNEFSEKFYPKKVYFYKFDHWAVSGHKPSLTSSLIAWIKWASSYDRDVVKIGDFDLLTSKFYKTDHTMLISDLKNPYIQLSRTKINLFFKFDHWSLLVSVPVTIHLGCNAPHHDAPPS